MATMLIISKIWKQPRCSSVAEWVNCNIELAKKLLEFLQTMEHYLMLKRNELSGHEKTWMNLKCIALSEII